MFTSPIIESKFFHNDNLVLTLEFDEDFETYHIMINRKNNNESIDMFGLFLTLADAKIKFDSIQL